MIFHRGCSAGEISYIISHEHIFAMLHVSGVDGADASRKVTSSVKRLEGKSDLCAETLCLTRMTEPRKAADFIREKEDRWTRLQQTEANTKANTCRLKPCTDR